MLDRRVTYWIKPGVDRLAGLLAGVGTSANMISFAGFGIGLTAAVTIALQWYLAGLVLILISRLCDALDGAVARLTHPSDQGGFLDITLDFLFYASIVLGFAWAEPAANALAAATLLASFMGTASSFLAFAVIAAKRKLHNPAFPEKSFYFLGGLTEATETLLLFLAMCLWPAHFAAFAYLFAGLCLITTVCRIVWGWKAFSDRSSV